MPPLTAPSTLDLLWTRLRGVRRVVLEVTDLADGGDGRCSAGTAEGVVEWLNGRPQEITWREQGRWTAGPLAGTRFSSAYCWTRRPDEGLSISHLRFGTARPVALVDLAESGEGVWDSAAPHHCGEDRYAARVELVEDGALVSWTVTGPTTGYLLRAHYSSIDARTP